ncbi:LysR family transcriptional regulator [Vibrio genomosp. F10]|uniref:LysR family transcriptional regulator n=2 Tax=Vibrio genomosp. F10 TaxID=723171 RepID=A0A1B9R030_9VIBR|nr:LysR family transcriptional regulator [Vibrio genomosp. F10]OCH76882.1 LysR family transcriptional regulator [Vibrio genomosp. F10]OEE35971.1 LysR family transcriptional regulator [Vibrio genomosp. F10 str. ZF-129]OEE94271.1 LysR family transcriptional regulator [Vibrio genomosp. F10 str. 9ZC157]OEE96385.1 LysR family transcriptional regulator [Vibrio genomosp. F10 str. 9ZD137]OEF06516.1 LysR family transcriptional regulator [Vibrio genomosp. F10 str. 9ZB36]
MGQLESIRIFIKVVETGSITKASEQLGLAKSAISKRLSELEQQLGTRLINRTTRKSSLTEAGLIYFQKSKLIAEEIDVLNGQISSDRKDLVGTLKLAVPLSFGVEHLVPALDEFSKQHKDLKLDIDFSDRKVDLIGDGFDLAVRIGELTDSTLRAKAITPIRHLLCASPAYLDEFGTPQTPDDLSEHQFLRYSQMAPSGLSLLGEKKSGSKREKVTVSLNIAHNANNGEFLKSMAVSGHGITYLPQFIIWKELKSGALKQILASYTPAPFNAYVVFPEARYLPQKSRVFIDFLSDYFGETPYWESDD